MNPLQNENPNMFSAGCNCNCGTRISLDEQLINERQEWKQKYFCLQKQTTKDVGLLKERIYQECSTLMFQQAQFNKKEKQHADIVNKKNIDIQQLTARVIKLQTAFKVSEKEKEVLKAKLFEEQQRYNQKLQELSSLKNKHVRSMNQIQEQNLSQTGTLKIKIGHEHEQILKKLEAQNDHLKHKVKDFQKRYQAIIPEVQKLKNLVNKKTSDIDILEQQLEKTKQSKDKQIVSLIKRIQETIQLHTPCVPRISELNEKISDLQNQLAKAKIIKRQVKVQPVYVDRPVQVQRVVQKIIEVQRIVKQYLQPEFDYKKHEQENKKLRSELQSIVHELNLFEGRYEQMLRQNQESVRQYEQNIQKYKNQRDGLAKRIHEQDEELQKICRMVQNQSSQQNCSSNPEKIVVQVNKDGTVNKRIQKIDIQERVNVQTTQNTVSNMQRPKQPQAQSKNRTTQQNRVTRTITQAVHKK